jgi:hypothetical protein
MEFFKCRACAAREEELRRLHANIQRLQDLLAEKYAPGASQRVPHAMPLPPTVRPGADGEAYVPQLIQEEDVLPGYEPEVTVERVKLVEIEES